MMDINDVLATQLAAIDLERQSVLLERTRAINLNDRHGIDAAQGKLARLTHARKFITKKAIESACLAAGFAVLSKDPAAFREAIVEQGLPRGRPDVYKK